MDDSEALAARFEENRAHLRAVAYRMLGSVSEADDAVQEGWLRLNRQSRLSRGGDVANLRGWLTTVVARVCLDMLRSRRARRESPLDAHPPALATTDSGDPAAEAELAESVGLALLVVLDTLAPAERLAFVLHDMFAVPFDEIAAIVGRSPAAVRQLASRARRRVRSPSAVPGADQARRRELVDAFLAASRDGSFEALLALLDPDVVVRADAAAVPPGAAREVRGAAAVARQALIFSRGARHARAALVDGLPGIVVAPRGRVAVVLAFRVAGGRIVEIDVVADPARLRNLELTATA